MPRKSKLTPRQKRFVVEYLKDLNATQAAKRAKYSKRNADKIGAHLIGKSSISGEIRDKVEKQLNKLEITAENVLREYARVGFSDIRDHVKYGPSGVILKDSDTLEEDSARAVSEVSQTISAEGGSIRFKLHNKIAALDMLAKHLKLIEITPEDNRKSEFTVRFASDDATDNPEK